jgi:hypothetical protein
MSCALRRIAVVVCLLVALLVLSPGRARAQNWSFDARTIGLGVERTNYVLDSLFTGGEFVDTPPIPAPDVRVELPVDVRANLAYNAARWTGIVEYGHGYNGTSFRGGYEQRFGAIDLRGGARYINERWEPTGGLGFNLGGSFGIDVAAFGTSVNLERKRHVAIAVSLRFMRGERRADPSQN